MKIAITLIAGLAVYGLSFAAPDHAQSTSKRESQRVVSRSLYQSKPKRLDGPLRELNISDEEVREIEKVVADIVPGAIVNISGVTVGCPCEDGPGCTSQVWIVAYRDARSDGLMLSRIENRWDVGYVQKWWLKYETLLGRMRGFYSNRDPAARAKFMDELLKMQNEFPQCASENELLR